MDFQTFITEALPQPDESAPSDSDRRRQPINLEKGRQAVNNRQQDLKEALLALHAELKTHTLDRRTVMQHDWEASLSRAERLGAERIHAFLAGLLQLKTTPPLLNLIDFKRLHLALKQRLSDLAEAVNVLNTFGYFEKTVDEETLNRLENKHVLVVEDMLYNRILLRKILQRYHCITSEAVNGKEAVEWWSQHPEIDLVIMDMNMPVMDGFEATRQMRQIESEKQLNRTPIVALTALAMRGDREKCLAAGCDEYMTKPVETGVLLNTCNKVLSGTETASEEADTPFSLDISKILLKTDHQVYDYVLGSILRSLGIDFEKLTDLSDIETYLLEDRIDFLILEAETDLALAYFVKNHFPDKHVILITTAAHSDNIICAKTENNIRYPFSRDEIISVLQHYSHMQLLAQKRAENIADADSLSRIKGQASLKEAVDKSNQQLAVWQKAFRKIGGDLVLSHQFNLHGKYGFILGDVSGHDIQSGYTATWFAGLVKGVWGQYSNPLDLLRYLNSFLEGDTEEEDRRFVCALILLWDPLRHKLSYANAGIPGGILVKKDTGKATMIKWTGIPIGLFPEMDMFDHDEIDFDPGDRIYVATDGVLEAIPSEVISGIGETKSDEPPQQALESIVDFVTRSIEVTDDLTIAVFEGHHFKEPPIGFRRSIKSTHPEIESVLSQIETYLNETQQGRFDLTKVLLAAREALINALAHGNNNIPDKPIDIDLEVLDDTLQIRISDSGGGFDPMAEKQRLADEGDLRIHGRGIELMENICQSISYNGSGVCLEFAESDAGSDAS